MSQPVFITRPPHAHLRGLILRLVGYAEGKGPTTMTEVATLVFPVIFSFGAPWRIGLGDGEVQARPASFTAGLFAGPVHIESQGSTACIQVDLSPLGAARLFGAAAADLAGRMVDLDLMPGFSRDARALSQRLAETHDWSARLDLAEAFIAARLTHRTRPAIAAAWQCLSRGQSVGQTAAQIGWSHRHLTNLFRAETGIAPVTAIRILRLDRAMRMARARQSDWAGIAAEAGYADQSHMVREFGQLAGASPTAWARRLNADFH